MSRIRKTITLTAGAAAGLFLGALASSATAAADNTAPLIPGLPGVVDQVITGIPQQLLQTTTSALTGATAAPAAATAPAPIASATLNLPQTPAGVPGLPGITTPAAGVPGLPGITMPAAAASGLPGFQMPASLSQLLPFPLPNLGGTGATAVAPSLGLPSTLLPSVPAAVSVPSAPIGWLPVSGLP